jgi:glycerol-3-phosphate dehydrogenase
LRPLLRGAREPSSKISREHTVVTPVPGLVMIAGGKLTTYRVMAKDAIDAAAHSLRSTVNTTVRPSITERVPLVGAEGFEARSNQRVALARRSGLHVARIDHLLGRYGGRVDELLDLLAGRPELAEPLTGSEDYLAGEVVHAVTHEGARHLDDVLTRRTRISIETFDRGIHAARPAAELMAGELGWDEARTDDEVDHYLRRVEAERQSQLQPTDQEADEARVSAPDIV